jgi:hypothetical protein
MGVELDLLTLKEEHRLRVFENRVQRRIHGPKRDEVMGGLRKLHNEEVCDLYSSSSIIRNDQVEVDDKGRACSTNGGEEEHVQVIRGKATTRKIKM